ncbi:MAG: hypothetical protein ABH812_00925 [bacterium]
MTTESRPGPGQTELDGQTLSKEFFGITSQFFVDQILPLIPTEQNIGLISGWEVKTQATDLDPSEAVKIGIDPYITGDYHEGRNEDEGKLQLSLHATGLQRAEILTSDKGQPNSLHAFTKLRPNIVTFLGHSDVGFLTLKRNVGTVINSSTPDYLSRVIINFSTPNYDLIYLHDQGKVIISEPNSTSERFYGHKEELKSMFDKIKQALEAESVDLKVEKAIKLKLTNKRLYSTSYELGGLSILSILQNPGLFAKISAGISALFSAIGIINAQGIDNTIIQLDKKIRSQRKVLKKGQSILFFKNVK